MNKDLKKIQKKAQVKKSKYVSFEKRVSIDIFLSVLFGLLFIIFLVMSFSITKNEKINYEEKSNVNYKVYLKENTPDGENFLGKDLVYVSSNIDDIGVDFKYDFKVDKKSNIVYTYKVIAKLFVTNELGEDYYPEREFSLLDSTDGMIRNKEDYTIDVSLDINYDNYKKITNEYKEKLGITTNSSLKVYFIVETKSMDDNSYYLADTEETTVEIPLYVKERDVKIKVNEVDNKETLRTEAKISITSPWYVALCLLFFTLLIIFINIICKKLGLLMYKDNEYDRLIKKLIRKYDRYIVDTPTPPNKSLRIIRVDSFDEMLDASKNVREPIMFYEITKHAKCEFYITHNNELYLYKVKLVDLEDNK
jgi:hypothetical protein